MNEETKEFWKKFYFLFGQNGIQDGLGWDKLMDIGMIPKQWEYPDYVDTVTDMSDAGYIVPGCAEHMEELGYIKGAKKKHDFEFTDKFIDEVLNAS